MYDLAICYSGGLDSLIAYNYAVSNGMNPICINVGLGQPYDEKEQRAIAHKSRYHPTVERIDLTSLYGLIVKRLSNQIIPSRNVLLATIGGMFAPEVWINALDGEQNGKEHDKSERFFDDTTKLLSFTNEFFQPQTIVKSPFAKWSKAETIKWALEYGIPLDVLFSTSTCYDGVEQKCGKCLTCHKRATAFILNNIDEPGYSSNPFESEYHAELTVQIPLAVVNNDYSRFTEKRCNEFFMLNKKLDEMGIRRVIV